MRVNGNLYRSDLSRSDSVVHANGSSVDFSVWSHETLAQFAAEAYQRIKELEADLEAVMEAYRAEVKREK